MDTPARPGCLPGAGEVYSRKVARKLRGAAEADGTVVLRLRRGVYDTYQEEYLTHGDGEDRSAAAARA